MKIKNGYYYFKQPHAGSFIYPACYGHEPASEKRLFTDSIRDYASYGAGVAKKDVIFGIEIGVLNGETSGFLLRLDHRIKLLGIDPLIPDSMEQSLIGSLDTINKNIGKEKDQWRFIQDYSHNVAKRLKNDSFDFVFIDGSHHYDDVKLDYELFCPKIKKGGLIYFHDSRMNRGGAPFHVGASKFVDELIKDNKMELIGEAFSLTLFRK